MISVLYINTKIFTMVKINIVVTLLAALIPMLVGMVWFSPKMGFGNAWMKATGKTEDQLKEGANMALIFGLTFLFAIIIAFILNPIVRHEFGLASMMQKVATSPEAQADFAAMTGKYGHEFHTFKHGVLHGVLAAITMVLPIVGTLSLFERKGGKYIWIHTGYWAVSMGLMGGVISAFS